MKGTKYLTDKEKRSRHQSVWEAYKKKLGKKIVTISNKNTDCETLTLWNGSCVSRYDPKNTKERVWKTSDYGRCVVNCDNKFLYQETFESYKKK